ncbi:MAG: 50S ribosomal protein L10 [candidate division FCPU426 bacterium]
MATNKAKKSLVLEKMREVLKENRNVVLTEFRGITVEQMTDLRARLRKAGVKLKVVKNSLSKKLFQEVGMEAMVPFLKGPLAVGFLGEDISASSKTLLEYAKQNELLVVRAAFMDGKLLSVEGLKAIADLPSREVLLTMLVSGLQSPLRNLLSVFQGTTRKLIYALQAVKTEKEKKAA